MQGKPITPPPGFGYEKNMFIIENNENCSYIDTLLMSLFYSSSYINQLLNKDITNVNSLYLQECIKNKFISIIKKRKSVRDEHLNFIRYILLNNGWKTFEELYNQQNIKEFYTFLINKLEGDFIEIQKKTISESTDNIYDTVEKIPYIPLSFPKMENNIELTNIKLKDMLFNWMHDNVSSVQLLNGKEINVFHSYDIVNIPTYIGLSIDRFQDNVKNNIQVDIQKKLRIYKNISPNNASYEWEFHSAICHVGDSLNKGHYYSLLADDHKWYIFDNKQIPCITEVKMDNINVTNKIRQECIFVIYKLNMY